MASLFWAQKWTIWGEIQEQLNEVLCRQDSNDWANM